MIRYKINILDALKKAGFNQTIIQREKILPSQTRQNIKAGKPIKFETLNTICLITGLQPGDILEEVPLEEEKTKYAKIIEKPIDIRREIDYNRIVAREQQEEKKRMENKEEVAVFKSYLRKIKWMLNDLQKEVDKNDMEEVKKMLKKIHDEIQTDIEDQA